MFVPGEQEKAAARLASSIPQAQSEFSHDEVVKRTQEIFRYARNSREKLAALVTDAEIEISKSSISNYRWSVLHMGRPFMDTPSKIRQMVGNKLKGLVDEMHLEIAEKRSYVYVAQRELVLLEGKLQKLMIEVEPLSGTLGYIDAKTAISSARQKCTAGIEALRKSYDELDRLSLEIDSRAESLYARLRAISQTLTFTYVAWMNDDDPISGPGKMSSHTQKRDSRDSIWAQHLQAAILHALTGKHRRDDLEKGMFETLKSHESYSTLRIIAGSEAYPSDMRNKARNCLDDMRCSLVETTYEKIQKMKKKRLVPTPQVRRTINAFRV